MRRTIRHYVAMIFVVVLLLLPLLVRFVHLKQIENSWHASDVRFQQTNLDSARRTLEKLQINTAMPGNGTDALTFTAPMGMMLEDTAYNSVSFSKGDTLESDFVTWSHDYFRVRMVKLTINGKTCSAKLTTSQLTLLYLAALRQNGLEDQFEADIGRRLNWFSARDAVKALDKTLFEQGIHQAYDYPYDRRRVSLILGLCVIFALPLAGMLMTLLSLASESVQYQIWLKQYNKEHTEHWDKLSGNLPQFVSLKESGLKGSIPVHRKQRLRDRFLNLFRPVRTGGVK